VLETSSSQTDESYAYDENGNRTMAGYDTGTNNQLESDGTYNYAYDGEGNRTLRTNSTTGAVTEYIWDWRNRLTKIVERDSATGPITKQTEFTYDVFDRRLKKSHDADGAGSGTAVVARYVYDGTAAILQFDGASNLTHRYLGGPTEIQPILADEAVTSLTSAGTLLWPLTDNLGTVRDLVSDNGSVQNHIKYDSFGRVTSESTAAVDFLFGFAAGIRDEETGLQYHRARYYDPLTGRWTAEDPIGFNGQDPNLQRYLTNSPLHSTDASGLISDATLEGFFEALNMADSTKERDRITTILENLLVTPEDVDALFDYQNRHINDYDEDDRLELLLRAANAGGAAIGKIIDGKEVSSAVHATTEDFNIPRGVGLARGAAIAVESRRVANALIDGMSAAGTGLEDWTLDEMFDNRQSIDMARSLILDLDQLLDQHFGDSTLREVMKGDTASFVRGIVAANPGMLTESVTGSIRVVAINQRLMSAKLLLRSEETGVCELFTYSAES
jgi:RHS repeat-associated protein